MDIPTADREVEVMHAILQRDGFLGSHLSRIGTLLRDTERGNDGSHAAH